MTSTAVAPVAPAEHPAAAAVQAVRASDTLAAKRERAAIDASLRLPVLLFFGSATAWLLFGSLLLVIASVKLSIPGFLTGTEWATSWMNVPLGWLGLSLPASFAGDSGWLTYGRVHPAGWDALAYGWAAQAGFAVAVWLMARLCRVPARSRPFLYSAWAVWNTGMLFGTLGVLAGQGTSVPWLDYPQHAQLFLFVGAALVSVWSVVLFRVRQPGPLYVSQWFIAAALLWFPWLHATANLFIFHLPVQPAATGPVHWWYAQGFITLYLTPVALAAAYYFIPKIVGRPVHSYALSILAFWALAVFGPWVGMTRLTGGPFPAWLVSAGVVAAGMMLIFVVATGINHHATMRGRADALRWSPTLRFVVVGATVFTLGSVQAAFMSLRSVAQVVHFTHFVEGHDFLMLLGFYSMVMFGAICYIVPRLMNWEWPSAELIRWHFWLVVSGVGLLWLALSMSGFIQGLALNEPKISFITTVNYTKIFLWGRTLGLLLILAGHVAFAASFVLMSVRAGAIRRRPTLLAMTPAEEDAPPAGTAAAI